MKAFRSNHLLLVSNRVGRAFANTQDGIDLCLPTRKGAQLFAIVLPALDPASQSETRSRIIYAKISIALVQ